VAPVKQQKPAVLTERDKRSRILRTMVCRVAREFDNHELVCLSNAHADLLVEFVERVCDRLGGTPMKKTEVQP
jgi:predicted SpoU family rRNA methylase